MSKQQVVAWRQKTQETVEFSSLTDFKVYDCVWQRVLLRDKSPQMVVYDWIKTKTLWQLEYVFLTSFTFVMSRVFFLSFHLRNVLLNVLDQKEGR